MSLDSILDGRRAALVLLHPSSLPDPPGRPGAIGELGDAALAFIDFLAETGVRAWQVLPLGHTGYGDSPYQTFSRTAGSPLLLSLDRLAEAGDLDPRALEAYRKRLKKDKLGPARAAYGWAFRHKLGASFEDAAALRSAFEGFAQRPGDDPRRAACRRFVEEQGRWLREYADFMALKEANAQRCWSEWPSPHRDAEAWLSVRDKQLAEHPTLARSVAFYEYLQFAFFEQWQALREHARSRGCLIVGDIPWYVGYDSADVWARRGVFELDRKGHPLAYAGVPPDYFAAEGQLWGNPLYDWDRPDPFEWWAETTAFLLRQYDILRIDHFRAVDSYWKVPREWVLKKGTAREGYWAKGPGIALLERIFAALPGADTLPLVAEDLGGLDPLYARPEDYPEDIDWRNRFKVDPVFAKHLAQADPALGPAFDPDSGEYSTRKGVDAALERFGLPWMSVLQFGFEGAERYQYDKAPRECVLYTGTHDNDTALGWYLAHGGDGAALGRCDLARHLVQALYHGEDDIPAAPGYRPTGPREFGWDLLELALQSRALLAGAPMQDLLGLGSEARMNQPGDHAEGWWQWRMTPEQAAEYPRIAHRLGALLQHYDRKA